MSAVEGKVRESQDFTRETGFFEAKVICVNPTREKLEQMLGTEIEKDPEYLGEDEDGKTKLNLVIWVQDVKTEKFRSVRFFLKDVFREKNIKEEDKETQPRKFQYINSIGRASYADKEENLPDWITNREYRKAKEGEEEFYEFCLNWLKVDTKDPQAKIKFDWKMLMRGNVSEITEMIGTPYEQTIVCLVTIKTVKKNGEQKEYEQIYNKKFLPGWAMKQIRLSKIDDAFIEKAKVMKKEDKSRLQKFVLYVEDSQWGCKDYYTLTELQKYDPTQNIAASDNVKDGDTSY